MTQINGRVARPSATDVAYQAMKDRILTLALLPGERVTEQYLVELLGAGTSKTPVRDALRWLVKDGFVNQAGRSYQIAPITIRETRDLFAFRLTLETAVVGRILDQGTDVEALVAAQTIAASTYDRADPESIRDFLREKDRFHLTMAAAADSPCLENALTVVLEKLQRLLHLMLRTAPHDRLLAHDHSELAAAIASRDRDAALKAITDHIRIGEQGVLDVLINLDGKVEMPARITGHRASVRRTTRTG